MYLLCLTDFINLNSCDGLDACISDIIKPHRWCNS